MADLSQELITEVANKLATEGWNKTVTEYSSVELLCAVFNIIFKGLQGENKVGDILAIQGMFEQMVQLQIQQWEAADGDAKRSD